MSQAKVDKRKLEKANRAKTIKKQKLANNVRNTIICVVIAAIAFWILYSLYNKYETGRDRTMITTDFSAMSEYVNNLE